MYNNHWILARLLLVQLYIIVCTSNVPVRGFELKSWVSLAILWLTLPAFGCKKSHMIGQNC